MESNTIMKLLHEFKPLIHKTVQRLFISQSHSDYDDFFQELQIKLISIYQAFDGKPLDVAEDRYRFTAYASKGLYWHGLSLLRNEFFTPKHLVGSEWIDESSIQDNNLDENFDSSIFVTDFFKQAKKRLSNQEFLLLVHCAEGKHTMIEISELMGVSRDTIYQRRNKIREKLGDLKECLMD